MDTVSLIANSGIQIVRKEIEISNFGKSPVFFTEDTDGEGNYKLGLLYGVKDSSGGYNYYEYKELWNGGFLKSAEPITDDALCAENIMPVRNASPYAFSEKHLTDFLGKIEGIWIPLCYSLYPRRLNALDWVRAKFVKVSDTKYSVIFAFDTRAHVEEEIPSQNLVFGDRSATELRMVPCNDMLRLAEYVSKGFVNECLFSLCYPGVESPSMLRRREDEPHLQYAAIYISFLHRIAGLLPEVKVFRETNTAVYDVDMIVDIGNSRTMALLVEDGQFDKVQRLELDNYAELLNGSSSDARSSSSFDMRLAFDELSFGDFGVSGSKQFVYPSFVRLGDEADEIIHRKNAWSTEEHYLSTYSSPKRYLWDESKMPTEWYFVAKPGETKGKTVWLNGISENLTSDGRVSIGKGEGGRMAYYSRRTLMTFAIMEILAQAFRKINSVEYREFRGHPAMPRRIAKILFTSPTAMSDLERNNLLQSAEDAVALLSDFYEWGDKNKISVEPNLSQIKNAGFFDEKADWRYDEATCAQLVYLYSEIGYKYDGASDEFMKLYGRKGDDGVYRLRVASVDIGAGTTDLMVSEVSLSKDRDSNDVEMTSKPVFFDSYYTAGDDMLCAMITNILFLDSDSAFRKATEGRFTEEQYRQKIKNMVGEYYNSKSYKERCAQHDLCIQYCVPLVYKMLELTSNGIASKAIVWSDVFDKTQPSNEVVEYVQSELGVDIRSLVWNFSAEKVIDRADREFEPLLKKVATIAFTNKVDIILLSGRPASIPAVRNIFLRYFPVTPDRLILLNNYYAGDWFPFSENTGYIKDSKSIVVMGATIGFYASKKSKLHNFRINTRDIETGMSSTARYIFSSNDIPVLSPSSSSGSLRVKAMPAFLSAKQIKSENYPARVLYMIDWDRAAIERDLRKRYGDIVPPQNKINSDVEDVVRRLSDKLPITLTLSKDADSEEKLYIDEATDRNEEQFDNTAYIKVVVNSLGESDKYWLETGILKVQ